jgi:hypothetical protein
VTAFHPRRSSGGVSAYGKNENSSRSNVLQGAEKGCASNGTYFVLANG